MQRYFTKEVNKDKTFELSKEDSYHVTKVMRMQKFEKVEIVSQGKVYIGELLSLESPVRGQVVEEVFENNELGYCVYLVQSLVKEQKMDFILQKAVELGVFGIYPYQAERSIVKVADVSKKLTRWNTITKEASEQAKRLQIPPVYPTVTLKELAKIEGFDYKFLCTVKEKQENFKKVLSKVEKGATMIIVVGPEGGFSDSEEDVLEKSGFVPISLGKSVLRTETAGMFCLSAVRYIDME